LSRATSWDVITPHVPSHTGAQVTFNPCPARSGLSSRCLPLCWILWRVGSVRGCRRSPSRGIPTSP